MPELPEVETTRAMLVPHLVGKTLTQVIVRTAKLRAPIPDLTVLEGATLTAIARRAKFLIWSFSRHGTDAGSMVTHLGMTGSWRVFAAPGPEPGKHDHVDLVFESIVARLSDPRRFGLILYFPAGSNPYDKAPLKDLGPEPFDSRLTAQVFYESLQGKHASIKQTLEAGRCVVGCGNIYCSESLWQAGIDPRRPAQSLTPEEAARLLESIREILTRSIHAGGTTIEDFSRPDGSSGAFAEELCVYGREGEPCPRCGTAICRIVQGGRSTFYCPQCQK